MEQTGAPQAMNGAVPEAKTPMPGEGKQSSRQERRASQAPSLWRIGLLCALFLATAALIQTMQHGKPVPLDKALSQFPKEIGPWQGGADERLPENIVRVLGVDDYVSRLYAGPGGPIHFYASYFATTWGGKSYHSPRNCMPGSGWDVATLEVVPLRFNNPHAHTVQVSRMLMQKGAEHQIVLYWYQGRGRIMPTEYAERLYRVFDSLLHQRTDGAFVRIIVPVHNNQTDAAMETALDFAHHIIPLINNYLPKLE